ncbi:MAG: VTT domain-containing protein [Candidatus Micrarchaeia archaeon]|jgi:membrane-associated protein
MIDIFSAESVLQTFGMLALFGFVFAESGLFFGFFLPGDSLLFTAGIFAYKGFFDVWLILVGVVVCAFIGDQVGYWTGNRFGPAFFCKEGSYFRNPKYIEKAQAFYVKHGKKAIVLARFVPVVRTFAPIFAGTARMDYATFTVYNAIGGILWSCLFIGAGYLLGSVLPQSEAGLSIIVLGIIFISLLPVLYEFWGEYRKGRKK